MAELNELQTYWVLIFGFGCALVGFAIGGIFTRWLSRNS